MDTDLGLLRLLSWMSPGFPTGGFACSHGLEWAVETGDIVDRATARAWLDALLRHGDLRSDAILLRHAWRAASGGDAAGLAGIAELAEASSSCRERREESLSQGTAFVTAARIWGETLLPQGRVAYAVAAGAVAAAHGVGEAACCAGFLHAALANLVSAVVRLVPLGQSDGLRVLAALEPAVLAVAAETEDAGLDDLGGICPRADLASMRHETQYTRLFRT